MPCSFSPFYLLAWLANNCFFQVSCHQVSNVKKFNPWPEGNDFSDFIVKVFTVGICNPTIWNPETFEFQMVRFSNGRAITMAIALVPTIWKLNIGNLDFFVRISNGFWQNGGYLSRFQMVGLPDFRSHSKFRPFVTQRLLDHSKSRLGWISDSHYIKLCFIPHTYTYHVSYHMPTVIMFHTYSVIIRIPHAQIPQSPILCVLNRQSSVKTNQLENIPSNNILPFTYVTHDNPG